MIGKNVYIDFSVKIGNNVKIENNSSVNHGVEIEDGVFVSQNVCLINDKRPRAINPNGRPKKEGDWEVGKILVKRGASIGSNSVILPGVTIGEFAMIGAGSVVTKDVPDYALAYGNPARVHGKVDKEGNKVE